MSGLGFVPRSDDVEPEGSKLVDSSKLPRLTGLDERVSPFGSRFGSELAIVNLIKKARRKSSEENCMSALETD